MSTTQKSQEEKIYQNYRSAIRLMRKSEGDSGRTANRKQRALKSVADKCGVRIREVKQIVRTYDAINGIAHDHPAPYQQKLDFLARAQEITDANTDTVACPICKSIPDESGNELRIRVDPRGSGLVPLFSCFRCYLKLDGHILD